MTAKRSILMLGAPLLSVLMLLGMLLEASTHLQPRDAEAYHARVRDAVGEVRDDARIIGTWFGRDEEIPQVAVQLLRPNIMLSRTYTDSLNRDMSKQGRTAYVLIVACKDSRDMLGHYPPICYPGQGMPLVKEEPRDWKVDGMTIKGMEYHFERKLLDVVQRQVVYNFMIVGGNANVRDMEGIQVASKNFERRYFGAAQFQVVFTIGSEGYDPGRAERDAVFTTLMGDDRMQAAIKTLLDEQSKGKP